MLRRGRDHVLRRLHLKLTFVWAVAWFAGIAAIGSVAMVLHARLGKTEFADIQRLRAAMVYGLTWFDQNGRFHDELLKKEPEVLGEGVDMWVIAPNSPHPELLRPLHPVFDVTSLPDIAARLLREERDVVVEGRDRAGKPYQLQAKVTYDNDDRPAAVIFVIADPRGRDAGHTAFTEGLLVAMAAAAALALAGGNLLSRLFLRPVVQSFDRQERLLAAAAHELRAPVANLLAVCESTRYGDTSPDQGLARVEQIAAQSAGLVDKLLVMARLDADVEGLAKTPLRLDLLIEAIVPEDGTVSFQATESVVNADGRLVQTAVRNLIENALVHGGNAPQRPRVRVMVQNRSVVVEDDGPGFPKALLLRATEPFQKAGNSPGSGLGLSIVQNIVRLHGGELRLENRAPRGARVTLIL